MVKMKRILAFLLCQIIFVPLFCFLLVYYGPFTDIRGTLVTTAMHTSRHKYLATWFLSSKKIDQILSEYGSVIKVGEQNTGDVIIEHRNSGKIEVLDVYAGLSKGKLMIVEDPSRMMLAVSDGLGSFGSTLSQMVSEEHAVAGINAGAYIDSNSAARGGTPGGVIILDGEVKYFQKDIEEHCVIGFDKNFVLKIKNIKSQEEANNLNLNFAVSFGPAIILNGKPLIEKSSNSLQPRTAIAQRKDGAVLLLVLDGRQSSSAGATLKNVQDILLEHGAYNAANLDGGSSTTMVWNNELVNNPSENRKEMYLPSGFLVKRESP